ncbi:(d)CMP kinase [Dongia soli]|uniref:Cytidylate kinase n=1 Tax=Dongia soli TaxID=600628 RepID=A0ABU5E791_9PROT|nr:(d)CMP kinase [Dongia soli]MDY0881752.1 (d)CMP kinase [Dongia soli]
MSLIIALDGPAAAGKGTLARRLAGHYRLAYLDTGALYRAVGVAVMRQGIDPAQESAAVAAAESLSPSLLNDPEIRTEAGGQAASKVAAIPAVRAALLDWQRRFAAQPPAATDGQAMAGAILDGRDIGTVVCPDAPIKLFITASMEARAQRRFKELQEKGAGAIYARVLQDMQERDARDQERAVAPLTAAPDALVIDTSAMTADEVFDQAITYIDRILAA